MISNYAERHGVILPPSGLVQTGFPSIRPYLGCPWLRIPVAKLLSLSNAVTAHRAGLADRFLRMDSPRISMR